MVTSFPFLALTSYAFYVVHFLVVLIGTLAYRCCAEPDQILDMANLAAKQ